MGLVWGKFMKRSKIPLICVAVAALVSPADALAIDPGVNYDPGSPAGKEYAIPLVEGRSDGAGTTNQQKGGNVPFGVGIVPPGSRAARREAAANGRRGTRAERRAARERARAGEVENGGATQGEDPRELAARIRDAEAPGGTAGLSILLALAVLLPAGLLTLLLRERGQSSRTGRAA